MFTRLVVTIALFASAVHSAPFFQRELVLSTARYIVRIDSTQGIYTSADSVCPGKRYFYFPVQFNGRGYGAKVIITKVSAGTNCALSVSFSSILSNRLDSVLDCSTLKLFNPRTVELLNDTTVIDWWFPLPTAKKLMKASIQQLQTYNRDIKVTLRTTVDSTSITLTQGFYQFASVINKRVIDKPFGGSIKYYDLSGRYVGKIQNHGPTGSVFTRADLRATPGVYLGVPEKGTPAIILQEAGR